MKKTVFLFFFLLIIRAWASNDDSASLSPSQDSLDTPYQTTKTDTSASDTSSDSTTAFSKTTKDSLKTDFNRLDHGFYLSPSWQFGSSPLMTTWYENQLYKKEYYDTLFNALSSEDSTISHESVFTQKPNDQSITFPFSAGFYKKIDSTKSFSLGIDYAFQRKRSVFTYRNKLDSTVLYENSASISSHRISLLATFEYTFNSDYFSVKGFPRTGISLGLGGSPFNWVSLKNNGFILSENSYGGIWSVGIFTEKNISANAMRRVTLCYTGSITQPYHSFTEQISTYSGESLLRSGSFGIKVMFIFSRKQKIEPQHPLKSNTLKNPGTKQSSTTFDKKFRC